MQKEFSFEKRKTICGSGKCKLQENETSKPRFQVCVCVMQGRPTEWGRQKYCVLEGKGNYFRQLKRAKKGFKVQR